MTMIYILNGPNLNLLGEREPEIYGHDRLADIRDLCEAKAAHYRVSIKFLQSNHEGEIIDWIHEARSDADAIIINPAAYSHTSIAILDALQTFEGLIAEVHLSNIHRRDSFRHHSYISSCADMVIVGCGLDGYGYCFDYIMAKRKQ